MGRGRGPQSKSLIPFSQIAAQYGPNVAAEAVNKSAGNLDIFTDPYDPSGAPLSNRISRSSNTSTPGSAAYSMSKTNSKLGKTDYIPAPLASPNGSSGTPTFIGSERSTGYNSHAQYGQAQSSRNSESDVDSGHYPRDGNGATGYSNSVDAGLGLGEMSSTSASSRFRDEPLGESRHGWAM